MFIASLLVLAGCSSARADSSIPVIARGSIDLLGETDSIELTGLWAFWPSRFVDPLNATVEFTRFQQFPSSWTAYQPELFPAKGYGTYALSINGLDPRVTYGFRFPAYSCAARYFVNGVEIYRQGLPADNGADEMPYWDTSVVPLSGAGLQRIELVLHLSNFNDRFPASSVPVSFGSFENLKTTNANKRLLMIIPFGAILAMGAYFLSLFIYHHEETSSFWLGLLCIVFAVRIGCYDEFILIDIIPRISPDLVFRLGYLTFSLAVAGFAGFVRAQYPSIAKKPVIVLIVCLALLYGLFNMAAPVSFFTGILVPFQLFTLLSAVYLLHVIVRAAIIGQDGASLFMGGFFLFMVIVVRDILIANRAINGVFLAHFGILFIIGAMGLIIVRHFSLAFNAVEAGAKNLEKINLSLSRFVPNEFLAFLGKKSITEICLGDNIQKDMCVMFIYLGIEMPLEGSASRLNMLELLNNTLLLVNPLIQKHSGFVDKYLADGVMALFPESARHPVQCALDVEESLENCNRERVGQGLPRIVFAAAIHRGSLMLGTIGYAERMDSTVISDAVNISSRMQKFAVSKKLSIVISGEVAASLDTLCPSPWSLHSHGDVKLRGKDRSVSIFEVLRG
jgi:adenylate cyclase